MCLASLRAQSLPCNLGRRGSRAYGQSELKIKKANSCRRELFLVLCWSGGTGLIQKSLEDFFTPAGLPKGCPNRPGGRLVKGGSRPYGQSELKIKKATSCRRELFLVLCWLLEERDWFKNPWRIFSPLRGCLKAVQIILEDDWWFKNPWRIFSPLRGCLKAVQIILEND